MREAYSKKISYHGYMDGKKKIGVSFPLLQALFPSADKIKIKRFPLHITYSMCFLPESLGSRIMPKSH